jgi:hypothetical protein
MVKDLEKIGFKKVYVKPYEWQFDIDGYYFKSDGEVIEWDNKPFNNSKDLGIKSIGRFNSLIHSLTGKNII